MPLSVTHPTPQGSIAGPFPWYQLVARHLSFLPLPSMTELPLTFGAPQGPPCRLSPAGRRKSFAPKSTPFSKIQTYIGLECQGHASSLNLLPQSVLHHQSGATAAELQGLPKHSVPIYVWIYENRAHLSTTTLTVFQEITGYFSIDQPQAA